MVRYWLKEMYIIMIKFLMAFFQKRGVDANHIVVIMNFKEDMYPIINKLNERGFRVTVFAKREHLKAVRALKEVSSYEFHQFNVLRLLFMMASAKVIFVDNLHLLMAGFKKKKGQTVIQTWHAAGALKKFGFEDRSVDHEHDKLVRQYENVYNATDKYLVGCQQMATCFQNAFNAHYEQLVNFGVPRLSRHFSVDIDALKVELKEKHGLDGKIAVYLPTYREEGMTNRILNKEAFESALPDYTLISRYHPSVNVMSEHYGLSVFELIVLADVIISDYSSLPIEASLIQKPTLYYVYDEQEYEKARGLNAYFYDIPIDYKVYREADIYQRLKQHELKPLFEDWHTYNKQSTLNQIAIYVDRLTKI
ncbi:teichoic acid glycerol-phosphate primase TarB [Staphylococcus agnetis]|uniref:teichoic acid glycerol-phosphate primase TarB n=1 Tax=Staphylococcus agnetis TaxID=985762 RepID=UPI000D1AFCB1|nr:teichoic acid glycerol-phosphate primase TarB [Staphylococcus agnetis]PTH78045.1 CDP-glycerol--poly(glycerophosphate) glycerophosphotransferase [Staphylococcus agnetis]